MRVRYRCHVLPPPTRLPTVLLWRGQGYPRSHVGITDKAHENAGVRQSMSTEVALREPVGPRSATSRRARSVLFLLAKFALAFGVIFWLYQRDILDFSALSTLEPDGRTVGLLFVAGLAVCAALVAISYRLWYLVRVQKFEVPVKDLLKLTWAAALCSVVAPGLLGADALKAAYLCSRVSERRMDVFAAILFDRIVGLISLFLLGSMAVAVAWAVNALPFQSAILWAAPLALGATTIGGFLVVWDGTYRLPPVQWLLHRAPAALQSLVQAFRKFANAPRAIGIAVVLSLISHGLIVLVFVLVAHLIHDPLSVFDHMVLNPIAVTMNAVPVTPGGLGVTEGTFAYLARAAGSDNGALIALMSRVVQYGVYLLGGLVSIFFLRWQGYRIPTAA
jgi:uncharacterized membrane protein YbhN (UPF0104 family)